MYSSRPSTKFKRKMGVTEWVGRVCSSVCGLRRYQLLNFDGLQSICMHMVQNRYNTNIKETVLLELFALGRVFAGLRLLDCVRACVECMSCVSFVCVRVHACVRVCVMDM